MKKNKLTKEADLDVIYDGYDQKFDWEIERIVGKDCDGSGYGGERDMHFSFKTLRSVISAGKKLKKHFGSKVRISTWLDKDKQVVEKDENYQSIRDIHQFTILANGKLRRVKYEWETE